MNVIGQQVLDTWYINHRTNLLLMGNLTEEQLELTTAPRGGGNIGYQLAHLYNVRFWKMERINRPVVKEHSAVKSKDKKTLLFLRDLHEISTEWIAQVLKKALEGDGSVKGNKRGAVPLLGYFIHHEAHHRGNIVLTLKRCGIKLPNEIQYGIWEWNKI